MLKKKWIYYSHLWNVIIKLIITDFCFLWGDKLQMAMDKAVL